MKAILEFDLNDPDDRIDHLRCVKSLNMAIALSDINYLWKKAERAMESDSEDYKSDPYEWWVRNIQAIFEDQSLTMDEIIQ